MYVQSWKMYTSKWNRKWMDGTTKCEKPQITTSVRSTMESRLCSGWGHTLSSLCLLSSWWLRSLFSPILCLMVCNEDLFTISVVIFFVDMDCYSVLFIKMSGSLFVVWYPYFQCPSSFTDIHMAAVITRDTAHHAILPVFQNSVSHEFEFCFWWVSMPSPTCPGELTCTFSWISCFHSVVLELMKAFGPRCPRFVSTFLCRMLQKHLDRMG